MNGRETECHQKNIHYKSNIVCAACVPPWPADHSARLKLLPIALQIFASQCVKAGWRSGLVRAGLPSVRTSQRHKFESRSRET